MKSIRGGPVNPRPKEMSRSLPPPQDVVDIFANAMELLERQNLVMRQLVHGIIRDQCQGLSQTSLTNSLSQALSESIVKQVCLLNLLMNHEAQNQQSQDSNQQFLESLIPSSQLPLNLRKEDKRSRSNKRVLPKIDLSGLEITCTELPSREKNPSNTTSVVDRPIKAQWVLRFNAPTPHLYYNCRQPGHFVRKCPKTEQNRPNRHVQGSRAKQGNQGKGPTPHVKQGKLNFTGIHFYLRTPSTKLVF
jgi:hypothetical protein